ncbi:MAG: hypothetical protein ABWX82_09565 [Leifsonia sp.]
MHYAVERAKSTEAVSALRDDIRTLRTRVSGSLYSPPAASPAGQTPMAPSASAVAARRWGEVAVPPSPGSADAAVLIAEHAAALARMQAEHTARYLKHLSRLTWASFSALAAGVLLVAAVVEAYGVPVTANTALPAGLAMTAMLVLLAIVSLLTRRGGGLIAMLIGKDGRFSTSAFQAWTWTVVLAWAFLFLVWSGVIAGHGISPVEDLTSLPLSADYLLLLGGPFAALVSAQRINSSKLASGDLQKIPAASPQVKDLVSNDAGATDLVDTQYLVFNTVAIAVFCVLLLADSTRMPDLPQAVVLLTSAAAIGYVSKKAVQKNTPSILTIVPDSGTGIPTVGRAIRIRGANFIPAGADDEEKRASVWIKFGTVVVSAIETGGVRPALAATEVVVEVPVLPDDGLENRVVPVVVVTAAGAETAAYPLQIASPCAEATLEVRDGRLRLSVPETVPAGTAVRVEVASYVEYVTTDAHHRASATVPAGLTGAQPVRIAYNGAITMKLVNL